MLVLKNALYNVGYLQNSYYVVNLHNIEAEIYIFNTFL
jgi:hypothetical protein